MITFYNQDMYLPCAFFKTSVFEASYLCANTNYHVFDDCNWAHLSSESARAFYVTADGVDKDITFGIPGTKPRGPEDCINYTWPSAS